LTSDGRIPLDAPGDVERTGTRVQAGQALVPALHVGKTSDTDRLSCSDLPAEAAVWSLPTEAGYPRIPMALVVGGVALAGASALLHPRSRGLVPFARPDIRAGDRVALPAHRGDISEGSPMPTLSPTLL